MRFTAPRAISRAATRRGWRGSVWPRPGETSQDNSSTSRRIAASNCRSANHVRDAGHAHRRYSLLEPIAKDASRDVVDPLLLVVADDNREVLFGAVETVEPVELGGHQFRRLLDPRRVLGLVQPHPVHVPGHITRQQQFLARL